MKPIVGGNWGNASDAGVFYVNTNNYRTNSNTNVGFRDCLNKIELSLKIFNMAHILTKNIKILKLNYQILKRDNLSCFDKLKIKIV